MPKSKFLMLFAIIELLSAVIFITLAVIFYMSKDMLGGDLMIPVVFGSIGGCALIAAPLFFIFAKKSRQNNPKPVEY